jgi:hypothetical protein
MTLLIYENEFKNEENFLGLFFLVRLKLSKCEIGLNLSIMIMYVCC